MSRTAAGLPSAGLATLLLAATAAAQGAASWTTDTARSRLEFTGTLAAGTFTGHFGHFSPEVVFDPADLAGSHFRVTIETGSADTREADRDAILKGPEFFAVERWPTASFVTTRFTAAGAGRYTGQGMLTLRDRTRDVTVTFTFTPSADGTAASLEGGTTLRRLDFGVGQGEWRDTQWVGDEVRVGFNLALRRQ